MFNVFLPYVKNIGTPAFRRRIVEITPWKDLQVLREVVDVMYSNARSIFLSRKRALESGDEVVKEDVAEGKDILSKLCWSFIMRVPSKLLNPF